MSSVVEQLCRIRNRLGRRLSRSLSRFDMADPAAAVGDADGCSSAPPAGDYSCSASQVVGDATSDTGAARDGVLDLEAAAGGHEVADGREASVRADSDADMDVAEEPLYGFVGPPPSPVLAAAGGGSDEAACSCCEHAGQPADCGWGPDDDDDPQLPADVAAAVRSARGSGAASRCGRLWRTLRALRLPRARHQRRVASDESELPSVHENGVVLPEPAIDLSRFRAEQFPVEDVDEEARRHRALELSAGVDGSGLQRVPAPHSESQLLVSHFAQLGRDGSLVQRTVHTTVDYVHCLVPDLQRIIGTPFYWGEMDRYEAERLLDNQPEGTFLLRDSAQEEYLFSVSFRRYVRSLHARVEQWNGQFTFDSHDPGVYASDTVTGLIEHYKDPSCCMFFEPMLTRPLHRNFVFPLSHLCRAAVVSQVSYDDVGLLRLPKSLRQFLMEYHYKQRIRVRRFELPDWREADSCCPADETVSS